MTFHKIGTLRLYRGWNTSDKYKKSLLKWLKRTVKDIEKNHDNLSKTYKTSLEMVIE